MHHTAPHCTTPHRNTRIVAAPQCNSTWDDWTKQVVASPQLLTYSLQHRIKPRVRDTLAHVQIRNRPLSAAVVARALKTSSFRVLQRDAEGYNMSAIHCSALQPVATYGNSSAAVSVHTVPGDAS